MYSPILFVLQATKRAEEIEKLLENIRGQVRQYIAEIYG